jgi:hypothetical protein
MDWQNMLAYGLYRNMHSTALTRWDKGCPYKGKDPIYPIMKGAITEK